MLPLSTHHTVTTLFASALAESAGAALRHHQYLPENGPPLLRRHDVGASARASAAQARLHGGSYVDRRRQAAGATGAAGA